MLFLTLIHFSLVFVQGFLEQGILVRDLTRLKWRCLKTHEFYLFDLASLLPTDLLYFLLYEKNYWPLIRLNRLLKGNRVLEFRRQTETSTNNPYLFRIVSIFVAITILIHWEACLFHLISKNAEIFSEDVDVKFEVPIELMSFDEDYSNSSLIMENSNSTANMTLMNSFVLQYSRAFYRATLQLTTIGNIQPPETSSERIYMVINYLLGVLLFAAIVGNITEIIDDLNSKRSEFQQKVDAVKSYMHLTNVNKELQERVLKWFEHLWTHNNGLDEHVIFQEFLPENYQAEIAINIHLETLKRVHIFQDCEPGLLQQLVTRLKLQVFSPGDFICRKGDIGREMYFIKSGNLNVVSDDGKKVFVTLKSGAFFGEISILNIPGNKTGNRRTANVQSKGFSDLFCLTKDDLWQALDEYPLARKTLMEKGKSLLRKDNILDEDVANETERLEKLNATNEDNLFKLRSQLTQIDKYMIRISEHFNTGLSYINQRLDSIENEINRN